MKTGRARELIRKYLDGSCTPQEKALLESWYLKEAAQRKDLPGEPDYAGLEKEIWENLQEGPVPVRKLKRRHWYQAAAAAVMLITLGTGFYFYLYRGSENPGKQQAVMNDLPPGGNKATLTLADGMKITLNDAAEGKIAEEAGITIRKADDGQIVYETAAPDALDPGSEAYNTIETPPGGQYRVLLPDGTRVWLNASSSLRYPARFTGSERRVELTGEGYFEVAQGKEAPFFVTTAGQEAEVLGTHFNINAYEDEGVVKTALLEGSLIVRVKSQSRVTRERIRKPRNNTEHETRNTKLLKPGQEATLGAGGRLSVREVDTEMVVAWKNGLFRFKRASVETVMRQLARWYDVEVVYEGEIPEKVFTGEIYRDLNASQVLDILSYTNLDFRIEGKKIIVTD